MKTLPIRVILGLALALLWLTAKAQQAQDYDALVQAGNSQLQAGNNEQALASATSAVKANSGRWEAYAIAGGALLSLKRYEEAADQFSHAIDNAPEQKKAGLRDLRKQCLLAEPGSSTVQPSRIAAAQTTQATLAPELNPERNEAITLRSPTETSVGSATAILHVIRSESRGGWEPYVFVDEQRTLPVLNHQNVKMTLPPGKHAISVQGKGITGSQMSDLFMEAGKEYWIKLTVSFGIMQPKTSLTVMSSQDGQAEATKLVQINFGNAFKN